MPHRLFPLRILAFAVAALVFHPVRAQERELAPVLVKGNAPGADPVHGSGGGATKLELPLRDVPQAVQSVEQALIRDQGALDTKDALRNISGVAPAQGEGRRDQFYIRGFDAARDTLVDGLRDDSLYFRDLGNVERIEVIKGPAAALYGRGSAGGVINRVTKKPRAETLREVGASIGSEHLRRIDLDLGGALNAQAAFRLTAAHEAGDSYRDVVRTERAALAPSIAWSAGNATSFLLQAELLRQRRTPDRGIPSLHGAPAAVPPGNFYGERYDYAATDARNIRFNVEHALNEQLTLRNNIQYSALALDALNTRTLGLTAGDTQVRRQTTYFPQEQTNYLNQTEAVYRLDGGAVPQTLLAGIELGHQKVERQVRAAAAAPADLATPQPVALIPPLAGLPITIDSAFKADTTALYVQDQLAFGQSWKALLGLRWDRFRQSQDDRLNGLRQRRADSVWSPRAGIVYQPNQAHALYANLSRSFQPVGNDFFYGKQDLARIKPLASLQQELGAKSAWLDGRLLSTVALYRIVQRNVVNQDPTDPAGLRQVQSGRQQSRGLEVDLSATLRPAWQLHASYTLNLARITQSNDVAVGNRPANIPRQAASLWTTYALGGGLRLGGGAFYSGQRYTLEDNSVSLPGYLRLDALLAYTAKDWEAGLHLNNLGNRVYYESANNNNQIQPGAPRNAVLFWRTRFR